MLGIKLYKNNTDDMARYTDVASACNEAGNLTIEDKGDYYEVVAILVHVPTEKELQQYFEAAIEAYMDSVVQTRNYKSIHTAASYVNSTNEKFAKEGAACNKWRDDVWAKCYAILAEVKAGTRGIPTLEEVIAELPVLEW